MTRSPTLLALTVPVLAALAGCGGARPCGCDRAPGPAATPAAAPAPVPAPVPAPPACALRAVVFQADRLEPAKEALPVLAADADCLRHAGRRAILTGHTDDTMTPEYALAAGLRLADVAAKELAARGVPADRLSTRSAGRDRPLCTEPTAACRDRNRRVELEWEGF